MVAADDHTPAAQRVFGPLSICICGAGSPPADARYYGDEALVGVQSTPLSVLPEKPEANHVSRLTRAGLSQFGESRPRDLLHITTPRIFMHMSRHADAHPYCPTISSRLNLTHLLLSMRSCAHDACAHHA